MVVCTMGGGPAVAASSQEVVYSALTEEAEVAEASESKGRTGWTPTGMRV